MPSTLRVVVRTACLLPILLAGCGGGGSSRPPQADFSLTVSPLSLSVEQGGTSAAASVSANSQNGFASSVSVAIEGMPEGATSSPASPFSVAAGSTRSVTFTVPVSAAAGDYSLNFKGTSGSLSHQASLKLTVTLRPDFNVSIQPSSVTVRLGQSSEPVMLTATSVGGFSGTVSFELLGMPAGLTSSPTSPFDVPVGASQPLTLAASNSLPTDQYAVTVRGTSGVLTHDLKLSAKVRPLITVPPQFVAKQFTEVLGRVPTPAEWQTWLDYFQSSGCNLSTLQSARSIYLGSEYSSLGLDNAAKVLTLYRGVLNREPDDAGYNSQLAALNNGQSWDVAVDAFFGSSEFAGYIDSICSGDPYYFGSNPAIAIPVTGDGFPGGTGDQLQALLNQAAAGTTVWLAQKSLTRLLAPLIVPAGVTLATTGSPLPSRYAMMGRLVRAARFDGGAVQLQPGATLSSVWVDGQRGAIGGYGVGIVNIAFDGGAATRVINSLSSNTAGWTSLFGGGGTPCQGNAISGNLVTVYSSDHYDGTWSDGISVQCQDALVENNQIVDASDAAIVLFQGGTVTQKSIIRNNVILSAGNSTYGGLIFDPLFPSGWTAENPDYSGSSFTLNTLWTGPYTHIDIAVSVGTMAWYHDIGGLLGTGGQAVQNTSGQATVRCNTGIGIDGMLNTTVSGNTLQVELVPVSACPSVEVGADVLNGHASGTIQPYVQAVLHSCIGH